MLEYEKESNKIEFEISVNELLKEKWITYDNLNFFKKVEKTFYEIKLAEPAILKNIPIPILEKTTKKENESHFIVDVIIFKNRKVKKELFGIKHKHEFDNNNNIKDLIILHRNDGFPSSIKYNEKGEIEEMKWYKMGKEYTKDISEIIKQYKIKTKEDIYKNNLDKIIKINKEI